MASGQRKLADGLGLATPHSLSLRIRLPRPPLTSNAVDVSLYLEEPPVNRNHPPEEAALFIDSECSAAR